MRRCLIVLLLIGMLSGCGSSEGGIDRALTLRNCLLNSKGCTFDAVITADYGDKLYTFSMKNVVDSNGNLQFEVKRPETIAGVTGKITDEKGTLTFDDKVLAFSLLADEQISPVSAPWLFIKTLRSGYINACESGNSGMRIRIDDSYEEDALQIDVWTDSQNVPVHGEIMFRGRRIITLDVENFVIL